MLQPSPLRGLGCNTLSHSGLANINIRKRMFYPLITRSRTPVPSQYLLHCQELESVAGSKYLGVEISNNLSFIRHIQNVTTSASQSRGFLKRNIRLKNSELKEMAYKTLVCPLVEYSSSVWSPYTKSNIARLKMVQRRAAC